MTPTFLFYRIDKNTIVTQVDAKEWSLMVKGLVNNPLVMNYDEIQGDEIYRAICYTFLYKQQNRRRFNQHLPVEGSPSW